MPISMQKGTGLIEILIAALILSVGLLAYAKLQVFAFQMSQYNFYRSIALARATSMAENIQINPKYALKELHKWQMDVQEKLPEGKGQLVHHGAMQEVIVRWVGHCHRQPCSDKTNRERLHLDVWV